MGDHSFNPDLAERLLAMERRPAAVLVPIIHREPEATVLFTQRTTGLRAHAGQIAFPGGRIDPGGSKPRSRRPARGGGGIGLTLTMSRRSASLRIT
jgi:8-oxo-dGTP pyrophosphatase MutT (NUDIX family)